MKGCYLIHFGQPFGRAKHYIGWSDDIYGRFERHRDGKGAALTRAVVQAGISLHMARTWLNADQTFERRLHNFGKSPLICPICNPDADKYFPRVETPALDGKHECVPFGKKFLCQCCDQVLTSPQRKQYCPGKGYYSKRAKVPAGLLTRDQWRKAGKRPASRQLPCGHVFSWVRGKGSFWLDLFGPDQVTDIQAVQS